MLLVGTQTYRLVIVSKFASTYTATSVIRLLIKVHKR